MSTYPWKFHVEWFRWLRKTREGHQAVTLNIPGDLWFAFWTPTNSHRVRIISLKVHWAINFIHKFKNNYPGKWAALCFYQGIQIPSTLTFASFWWQDCIYLRLASNLLCACGWLWTPDPDTPASAPPVLESWVGTTLPNSIFMDLVFPLLPDGKPRWAWSRLFSALLGVLVLGLVLLDCDRCRQHSTWCSISKTYLWHLKVHCLTQTHTHAPLKRPRTTSAFSALTTSSFVYANVQAVSPKEVSPKQLGTRNLTLPQSHLSS